MVATLGLYGIQDHGEFPAPRWTHDHCVALFVDDRLEWGLELERYTRCKHDNRLHLFLEQLITEGVLSLPEQFRVIVVDSFAGRTFLSASGSWRIEGNSVPLSTAQPLQKARGYINRKQIEAFHCSHELAHVATNLPFTGGFEDHSLLIHVDGAASQSNASAYLYKHSRFWHLYDGWDTLSAVQNFGYSDLTDAMLGLNDDTRMAAPGRLMGYAAYGQDLPEIRAWLRKHDWFRQHRKSPETFFNSARKEFGWQAEGFDLHDPFLMNIAASCQAEFEEQIFSLFTRLQERTKAKQLYAAGGAMLNVQLNAKLVASGLFDEVFIPPCCSDTGLAIGAAALAEFLERGSVERHTPFLNTAGLTKVTNCGHWGSKLDIPELGQRIAQGQVVALFTGAAEAGPRALGHRSILASPSHIGIRRYVSETIKAREWYRPVAPVILEELAEEVFPGATQTTLTNFMLCSLKVNPEWSQRIPGVVHVDGTARVQVVRDDDPTQTTLRSLLWEVWHSHQLPCLINTSFNGPGEPIVHTATHAKEAAQRLGVDVLVLEDYMESYVPRQLKR